MEPALHSLGVVAALLLAGVLLLNAIRRRFWCRYLCPLGGLLGLVSRAAWLQRRVEPAECLGCKRCARSCPTGTIDPDRQFASDPAECIMCLDCVQACQPAAVYFRGHWKVASGMPYDPSRRALAASAVGAVAGVALLRTTVGHGRIHPHGLQPPGVLANGLLERCVRCGACIQACPTGGLQPALFEAGLEGFGTPILVPRLGYCDFACNACGQVCPTGAIPPLSLAEKQQVIIGQASIDRDRCLAWTGDQPCIVCEEVCPIPDKAIWLETTQMPTRDGTTQLFQLPHVDRSRCIGCGICEHQCPLAGPAAIRVWAPSSLA
jgi:MauM/NapG family ferredoxin protein